MAPNCTKEGGNAYGLSPYLGSDQEKTFGPTISGLIHRHIGPERLLLWDSKLRGGRPDTMKILKEAYSAFDAEGDAESIHGAHIVHDALTRFHSCLHHVELHRQFRDHAGL